MKRRFEDVANKQTTLFICNDKNQITELAYYLKSMRFDVLLKPELHPETKKYFYSIIVPAQQADNALEVGKNYAIDNNLLDIIYFSPKTIAQTIEEIKSNPLNLFS